MTMRKKNGKKSPTKGTKPTRSYEDSKPVLMAYLKRIGAELRNFRTAIVKQDIGAYFSEIAVIRIAPDGQIGCDRDEFLPNEETQNALLKEFKGVEFPRSIPIKALDTAPDILRLTDPDDLYIFHDERNNIVFVQKRWLDDKGDKHYLPWSYWSDKVWRPMEPDGKLPIYGIEQLKRNTTLFLHEGAKAARHVRWMVEGTTAEAREALSKHPWGQEFKNAAHLGWIGGALAPQRTDWTILTRQKVEQIYFVCDNDLEGKEAVAKVARNLGIAIMAVKFDNNFPNSFDLADPFPDKLFIEIDGERLYRGPTMEDCKTCATWATEAIPTDNKKGRPSYRIRREFLEQWHYAVSPPVFVHVANPHKTYSETEFNNAVAPYSHVTDTARVLRKHPAAQVDGICYEPGMPAGVVSFGGSSKINTHVATKILPKAGDAGPWLEFMDNLIPNKADREHLLRWCATLIARIDRRVPFGVLLVSETQGVGKTTLAEKILAPLVGWGNVSVPSEREVVESTFNTWIARVRLVTIHEIYAGQSKRAYNDIKSYITERIVRVNEKFQPTYEVSNWAAFLAASNSTRALHMAHDDRRWFVPEVTERLQPEGYWQAFNEWLSGNGLNIIHHWAKDFVAKAGAITLGERAPASSTKTTMIEDSQSEGQRIVTDLARIVASRSKKARGDLGRDIVLVDADVRRWLADYLEVPLTHPTLEKEATIRSVMRAAGLHTSRTQVRINQRLRRLIANFPFDESTVGLRLVMDYAKDSDPWKIMPIPMDASGVVRDAKNEQADNE